MAVAAGCILIGQPGGRAGRASWSSPLLHGQLARAAPHGSPGAQEGHQRPAPAGVFLCRAVVVQLHDLGRLAVAGCGDDNSGAVFRFNGPCRLREMTTVVVTGPSIASGEFFCGLCYPQCYPGVIFNA